MISIVLKEKLDKLKKKFLGDDDVDDSAKKQILEWEKDILRLSQVHDFVNQPVTRTIVSVLKDRLKSILMERAMGTDHTPDSLKILAIREKEVRYAMGLFMPQYESHLETIEKLIDNEIS